MKYFIVHFTAIIKKTTDKETIKELGKIGVRSSSTDYKPNLVKEIVQEQYRKKDNTITNVAVVIGEHPEVSKEQYDEDAINFMAII